MAAALNEELKNKERKLKQLLRQMDGALVAFSGGVDSSYLLHQAVAVLGKSAVLAVTAASPVYPAEENAQARELASRLGVRHLNIDTAELSREEFCSNPPDRCYHCKKALFAELAALARKHKLPCVADGANRDDTADYRPGFKAAREFGVRSPLLEAGLSKEEIRLLSRGAGLPTWDKPAAACLASRFPYGEWLDEGKLKQVEQGELFLKRLGLRREVRVRYHGPLARIEVTDPELALVMENRKAIAGYFKNLGFLYVALDLEGFHSGSMNRTLPAGGTGLPPKPGAA